MKLNSREDIVLLLLAFLVLSGAGFRLWMRDGDIMVEVVEDAAQQTDSIADNSAIRDRPLPAEPQIPVESNRVADSNAPAGQAAEATLQININTASAWELERLPGIGPALAQRIVADRRQFGEYLRPDELVRVSGIGQKLIERLRPHVVVR